MDLDNIKIENNQLVESKVINVKDLVDYKNGVLSEIERANETISDIQNDIEELQAVIKRIDSLIK